MVELLCQLALVLRSLFKFQMRLEAKNLALRQELNVIGRRAAKRIRLTNWNRLLFVCLYRLDSWRDDNHQAGDRHSLAALVLFCRPARLRPKRKTIRVEVIMNLVLS